MHSYKRANNVQQRVFNMLRGVVYDPAAQLTHGWSMMTFFHFLSGDETVWFDSFEGKVSRQVKREHSIDNNVRRRAVDSGLSGRTK